MNTTTSQYVVLILVPLHGSYHSLLVVAGLVMTLMSEFALRTPIGSRVACSNPHAVRSVAAFARSNAFDLHRHRRP